MIMNESPRDLHLEAGKVDTSLPFTFRHRGVLKPKVLLLFLHGYSDHGGSFVKRLFPDHWPETFQDAAVLAPNGPFPVPVKSDAGWREAYAWYFFDEKSGGMIITPETSIRGCLDLISKFGYEEIPKVIVAFSQGGYLAPQLARKLNGVKEIIAIATGFREDYYPSSAPWVITAIHGSDDPVFPINDARDAHARILKIGYRGEFFEVPKLTHVARAEVGDLISKRVKTWI